MYVYIHLTCICMYVCTYIKDSEVQSMQLGQPLKRVAVQHFSSCAQGSAFRMSNAGSSV